MITPGHLPNDTQFARISEFALGPLDVPEAALRHCATLLIDTLGVAAGAAGMQAGTITRQFAVEYHMPGPGGDAATMLFDGRRASLPGAVWAVASQIDNLDGHDGYNPTKGHIGCAVVPALIALAEHREMSGREALTALAMSYELAARAGIALHASVPDYHTSGAWNGLGVAALACRLRGAGPGVLRHALGIAEYHGPRSQMMREIDNPTMLHDGSGMGALVGLSAAIMAERGFTGAPAITAEAAELSHIWQDLGQEWTVALNYIKPYPICRWAHAALDALSALMREGGVTPETVQSIRVNTFTESAELWMGVPRTTSEAQYSLAFAMAVLLVHGRVGPEHIEGAGLSDPAVAKLIPRISAVADPRHSGRFPTGRWSDIEVELTDGRVLKSGDVHARGGPEAWMDDAEVEAKFHAMAGCLAPGRRAAIWAMRDALLDPGARFSDLMAHLFAAPEAT